MIVPLLPVIVVDDVISALACRGVEVDHVEANKWFRRAADQGFAEAQFNLGDELPSIPHPLSRPSLHSLIHSLSLLCAALNSLAGSGIAKDEAVAFKYFKLAADQNMGKAQFKVGVIDCCGVVDLLLADTNLQRFVTK